MGVHDGVSDNPAGVNTGAGLADTAQVSAGPNTHNVDTATLTPILAAVLLVLLSVAAWRTKWRAPVAPLPAPPRRRLSAPTLEQLTRPVAVVVGASRGLGLETARILASQGTHTVVLTSRTVPSGRAAITSIKHPDRSNALLYAPLDIRDSEQREHFVSWLGETFSESSIVAVVVNAGITDKSLNDPVTAQAVIETNSVGTVDLATKLLSKLTFAPNPRLVFVTSQRGRRSLVSGAAQTAITFAAAAQSITPALRATQAYLALRRDNSDSSTWERQGWPAKDAYGVSKLLLGVAVQALANVTSRTHPDMSVVAVCPGWCRTDMGTSMAPRSVADGAKYIAELAASEALVSGHMYSDGAVVPW